MVEIIDLMFHTIGLCPDGHSHFDLLDYIIYDWNQTIEFFKYKFWQFKRFFSYL
jgi:hypothetical protein